MSQADGSQLVQQGIHADNGRMTFLALLLRLFFSIPPGTPGRPALWHDKRKVLPAVFVLHPVRNTDGPVHRSGRLFRAGMLLSVCIMRGDIPEIAEDGIGTELL